MKAAVFPAINRRASEIRLLRSLQLYQMGGCAQNPLITTAIAKPIDMTSRGIQTGILEPRGLLPSCITVLLIWKASPGREGFLGGAGTRHAW
jgi:hypothetical protein